MSFARNILAIGAIAAALTGCYVVPVQSTSSTPYQYGAYNNGNAGAAVVTMAPIRPVFTARLYPANETAAKLGQFSGIISNPERGHGEFTFAVGGEAFRGEATRAPNSTKGVANATGTRGAYVRCEYTMSSAELGSGSCNFSNGARFDMHVSQ